jgi:hypothetical protein
MGWIGDVGSGKKFIPDPGFMGQKSPGSGSATLVYIYLPLYSADYKISLNILYW